MDYIKTFIIKAVALIIGILAIGYFLFYLPYTIGMSNKPLIHWNASIFRYIAFVPLVFGVVISSKCMLDFLIKGHGTPTPIDHPKQLIVTGFYRYSRNPMYIGVVLILLGYSMWFLSLRLIAYTGAIFFVIHMFIVLYEEPLLKQRFGESYIKYCQQVPRWILRINIKK